MNTACASAILFLAVLTSAFAGEGLPEVIGLDGGRLTSEVILRHSKVIGRAGRSETYVIELAEDVEFPSITFKFPQALDWSLARALTLRLENASNDAVTVLLRVDDAINANGDVDSFSGQVQLAPAEKTTILLPLAVDKFGMLGSPPTLDPSLTTFSIIRQTHGVIDYHHINALHVSGVKTSHPVDLTLGEIRLDADYDDRSSYFHIADEFGQATLGTWPEKVFDVDGLKESLVRAAQDASTAPLVAVDVYGGLSRVPMHVTGFFHTEWGDNRWWLVTPTGHAYFSLGVNSVRSDARTLVSGRDQMFTSLPARDDPRSQFFGPPGERRWFDFYRANLSVGLGRDWHAQWILQTVKRLKAWGINTLGSWSETPLTKMHLMPFVMNIDLTGRYARVPMQAGDSLPDPFDPQFVEVVVKSVSGLASSYKDDPWLIGFFAGNELHWSSGPKITDRVAAHVMTLSHMSPAKQAFVKFLQSEYIDPIAFSAAWGILNVSSWDTVLRSPVYLPTENLSQRALSDLSKFEQSFAIKYFRTLAETLRQYDPNHLFLGSRFATWTSEAVSACDTWCDVLSFNIYRESPEELSSVWQKLTKPVLISEFHFGSLDRGSFWPGLVAVPSEEQRGPAYSAYLSSAGADPHIVGAHWFQYSDEPLTGRLDDGENGHIGLVAITDIPFQPFVAYVERSNWDLLATLSRHAERISPNIHCSQNSDCIATSASPESSKP